LSQPIILLLNGSNDNYKKSEFSIQEDSSVDRYYPSVENDTIVEGKQLACEILIAIARMETDAKCTVIMGKLKHQVYENEQKIKNDPHLATLNQSMMKSGRAPLNTNDNEDQENIELIEAIATFYNFESVNTDEYVCMLFDLMLYRYPQLAKRVF
jgi:hypothetical protein